MLTLEDLARAVDSTDGSDRDDHRSEGEPFHVSDSTRAGIRALRDAVGATSSDVLLAAFAALLSHYGDPGIVEIATTGERSVSCDVSGDTTFRVLVDRIRAAGARSSDGAAGKGRPRVGFQLGAGPCDADLVLRLDDEGDGLTGFVDYVTAAVEPSAARIGRHYATLLESGVDNPDARVRELDLLGADEERRVLVEWNDTAVGYPADATLRSLFEAQVERTPDAVALRFEDRGLTFADLNALANRLASHLRSLGVGHGSTVGVCAERSIELVVALYAVIKAGAAYLPLDPDYPAERLGFMLDDAAPEVVLVQEHLSSRFPQRDVPIVRLESPEWREQPAADGPATVTPGDAAYVLYTSGSTGTPKGVVVEHRGICNRLLWMQDEYRLGPDDVVLQKTPYSFDVSVWEFFWPLLAGARLVVAKPGGHRDGEYLARTIEAEGVTTIHFVPSMLRAFLDAADPALLASLRRVICSGEALAADLEARFFEHIGSELHNLYGPTEASVDVTAWRCRPDTSGSSVPIGRPIANTSVYVLDEELRPAPVGVTGELYLGGVQLARGYLNRPGTTAERFLPDPFSEPGGKRLYRTGDLARWRDDGALEFLGRIDHQVKLRGFRVELGEVEAALLSHPSLADAVVTMREDGGEQRLVAYVVPVDAQEAPAHGELRASLAERLPEFMLPSAFVALDALPLSANGKVDRRALPAPEAARPDVGRPFVAPDGPLEHAVGDLFAELLGLKQVGADDDFFELGGHSLLAQRLVWRLRETGHEVPIRTVFDASTVRSLAALLTEASGDRQPVPPLEPTPREGPLPPSFAQERLWFLDQLHPGSPEYVVPIALDLVGSLDRDALERALAEIVARHETLRTGLTSSEGEPVQVIAEAAALPLDTDLRRLPRDEADERARELEREDATRPFDLARPPLLRARLIRLGEQEHRLLVCMHHVVSDGWSLDVLGEELRALYGAFTRGEPSPLAPLEVQYADYARWQRAWLDGGTLERQLDYWREQLRGLQPLELPTDRPRPPVRSSRGSHVDLRLPDDVTGRLHAIGRERSATLFMTMLAAVQALLGRYSGQRDVAVGIPIAGRGRRELDSLIGFFVNTLVLRTDLSGNPTFLELLDRVRETALEAYAHQDLPFERLVSELQPQRDLSRTPLFQVMLVEDTGKRWGLEGLEVEPRPVDAQTAKFDLTLLVTESGCGRIEYASDLFDRDTVEAFAGHLQTLLASVAEDPERRLCDLELLGEEERRRLLDRWEREEFAAERPLHELFAEQASRTPDAPAVTFEGRTVSYLELDERTNRLAHLLRARGVGPGRLVALFLERSLELPVAVLAVLKAGGAYVPLDPAYPPDRLAFVLEDAKPHVLVSESGFVDRLPETAVDTILVDRDAAAIEAQPAEPHPVDVGPDDLAYVIYTSGSTGKPKGVLIEHRNVTRLFAASAQWYAFSADDVWTLFHSYAFDFSVWELWGALLHGGRLVVVPYLVSRSPDDFYELLVEEGVTVLNQTPTAFGSLVAADERTTLRDELRLRVVVFGGEALDLRSLRPWYARHRDDAPLLVNMYGITETTVHVTYRPLAASDAESSSSVVGVPIPDLACLVCDEDGNLVPEGVPGELLVGGAGVARGYLNRPALTAERFVPDPFGSPGRLYRSGDLVRARGGELEYLGRIDKQVKIRGFRIELGEVQAALLEHRDVGEAVVVARADAAGEKRLVAYVVTSPDRRVEPERLRSHLAERLPEYMLPAAFVELDALPLTPNGKIDTEALPDVSPERPQLGETFEPPAGPVEEQVAAVYCELLGLGRVGARDDFFELGGHSLLAARLVARLRAATGRDVPLRAVFEHPSVRQLASTLDEAPSEDARPVTRLGSHEGPLPLSFAQERLWFLDQLHPESAEYLISLVADLDGALDRDALEGALGDVVARHETLRTSFAERDGRVAQHVAAHVAVPLSFTDLGELPEGEAEERALELEASDTGEPFDLTQAPLFRVRLVRFSDVRHRLVVCMHHTISDGWSLDVFTRELGRFYDARRCARDADLPPLEIQYADYADWQRRELAGDVLERQLDYWRERLEGAPARLELAEDHGGGDAPRRGGRRTLVVPAPLAAALKRLGQEHGATVYMTLLAAFKLLLFRLSGQEDVVVGAPIAGRDRPEVESLIGLFVNTVVLRTDLSGDPGFSELLARVRDTAIGAYAHHDVPFEKVVEALAPDRDLERNPIFDVMFNFNTPETMTALGDLEARQRQPELWEPKFALTVYAEERGDELVFEFVHRTAVLSEERMAILVRQFELLLEAVSAAPDVVVSTHSLVDDDLVETVLPNPRAPLARPVQEPVANVFARVASELPDQPAITSGERSWSYAELAGRVAALARAIEASEAAAGDVVAVVGSRSPELVAGMLAVLASRRVLLVVDRDLPAERQLLVAREAGTRHAVCAGKPDAEIETVCPVDVVTGDEAWEPAPPDAFAVEPDGNDAAYVFFTSGTSGTPKAVLGSHDGLAHFLAWQRSTFEVGPRDRAAQLTSLSFDVLLRDVLMPLTSGATLCIPEPDEAPDGLFEWLRRERVSIVHTVPSIAQSWLAGPSDRRLDALRCVFFAGEPLKGALVSKWRERVSGSARIVNLYGPTETTLARCFFEVPEDALPDGPLPVGRPLPESQTLVVGDGGRLCSVGEPGEVVIRTPFRSLGYVNGSSEDARRFVPNPFGEDTDDVVYRTGDRGRYLPNGELELLGRLDDQIKIRGVRIEPAEIEALLLRDPAVGEAFVCGIEAGGVGRLVAYVAGTDGAAPDSGKLRASLRTRLPDYMVPSAFVVLDRMPLTANGKVDRRALPEPDAATSTEAYVPARTPAEERVAAIFAEVLQVERVGARDDFFALGGHSLVATQVVSRLRDAFGTEVTLRTLFETPTVAELAAAIGASALAQLQASFGTEVAEAPPAGAGPEAEPAATATESQAPPLVPVARNGDLPLSFSQQRLWFLDQLEPGSPEYVIPFALRLRGALDRDALEHAVDEIVARHEVLRSRLRTAEGVPRQVVGAPGQVELTQSDVDAEADLAEALAAEAARPFDLEEGPLFRARLFRVAPEDHVLLFTMHHVASDAWSLGILADELAELYAARAAGRPAALPDLPVQYPDFAVWQRTWLDDAALEPQLDYWRGQLEASAPLELPTDHPRPATRSPVGETVDFDLPAELVTSLEKLARAAGATLFMTTLAAFQVLLARYCDQADVAVGTLVAGRNRSELEPLIGSFVNTLVLRTDLSGDPTFRELVGRVRETSLAAFANQDAPFERLVDELRPERDLGVTPLFQVLFELQNAPAGRLELPGLDVREERVPRRSAPFDLALSLVETPDGLEGRVQYSTDLFERRTAEGVARCFQTLLRDAVSRPDTPIGELELLDADTRRTLVVEWNDTAREYPRDRCLHELVEEQTERTPDAPAVRLAGDELSYAELNASANRLAHDLRARGVGPETLVGICVERSLEQVVATLAVLKAGAAYVPLDPDYPPERLAFMLEDTAAPILLTQRRLRERLLGARTETLCLDEPSAELLARPETNPSPLARPGNLAYIIYTSGSTGRPKGIAVDQRGICNYVWWMQDEYGLEASDRVLQVAAFSFDISVWEMLWPLVAGAALVVAEPKGYEDPDYLARLIEAERVTTFHFVPSLLRAFLDALEPGRCPSLKRVFCSAETLPVELEQRFYESLPNATLTNLYGATEVSVDSTCWRCERGSERSFVPVGRPISNTRVYLLDSHLRPVPSGVHGEIYLAGDSVTRGYHNRRALTAERFLPDPYTEEAGSRMYRTGDRGRLLPDGNLDFLERIDHQVKLRGFRIELGEIEANLATHPSVDNAVAVVRDDDGHERLVAYVVAQTDAEPRPAELRRHLREHLPEFMLPNVFVVLDELPLNPNGKLDRKALPAPAVSRSELEEELVEPRSEEERALAEIWAELLRVERVGVHDNFFELGGDSILSIQTVWRAREAGLEISPRLIFEHQTIAELAAAASVAADGAPVPDQGPVAGRLPLTPIQRNFFELDLPEPDRYNQSALLEASRHLDPELVERALQALVTHHDALRLRFEREGARWEQRIVPEEPAELLRRIDLSSLEGDEQLSALEREADAVHASLDLARGPLVAAALFDLGRDQGDRLLVAIHHLAVDGVSWRILLEDLETALTQLASGDPVELPPKTTSYKEWAERLAEHAASHAVRAELDHWAGQTEQRPLSTDEAGENTRASARTLQTELTPELTEALLHEVPAVYRTQIDDVLLTALARAFADRTGRRSLLVDMEGHGREELPGTDVSRTVGWFTTIYPVLLCLPEGDEPAAALKAVKEQLRAVPGRGLGYGLLRYLAEEEAGETLADLPAPEVSFNYLGQLDQTLAASRLLRQLPDTAGEERTSEGRRSHVLAIDAEVVEGRLRVWWTYSSHLHRPETVEALANAFGKRLTELVRHCREAGAGGFTPSDFPLAGLDQEDVDRLAYERPSLEDVYPLSPLQGGMLFHTLYAPEEAAYIDQLVRSLRGRLDVAAFRAAWEDAVARHPGLRTSFAWEGLGRPVQVVHRGADVAFTELDWRELSGAEQEQALADYLAEDRAAGFDLTTPCPMRLALLRSGDEEHRLVWSFHHLLLDGWSVPLIWKDVFAAYNARSQGERARPRPGKPYRNYIEWIASRDREDTERYWRKTLSGFESPTPLPVEEPSDDAGVGNVWLRLTAAESAEVEEAARGRRLTLNTLVQGAWALLLSRYSRSRDVLFGATLAGRPHELPDVDSIVGMFINTLPVRTLVDPDERAGSWLEQLQERQIELGQYEHSSLVDIHGWSDLPGHVPLFETILVFENFPEPADDEQPLGLDVEYVETIEHTGYPLTVVAYAEERLSVRFRYERRRFRHETVERLARHFRNALLALATSPETRLADMELLDESERVQIVEGWNATAAEYPRDRCLHELFQAQVTRTPEATAIVDGDETVTYAELNARANRLAHYLRAQGVRPESLVAICVEPSLEMLVGLFGILKAGGAYVPLDPEHPADRLDFVLADTGAELVLTQERLLEGLPDDQARRLCLDRDWPEIAGFPSDDPDPLAGPENLVYVMYTSGSTGRPKGVMIDHRGLNNYLVWAIDGYGLEGASGAPMLGSIAFDLSIPNLFLPLIGGRDVTLLPADKSLEHLAEVLQRPGDFSLLKITPSHLDVLRAQIAPSARVESVRTYVVGADEVKAETALAWRRLAPSARIIDEYGPTETVVGCSIYHVPDDLDVTRPVSIGRPIANTRMYVLDEHLHPVPVGVAGELYIGGDGVARGYHRRAGLTAERFVPDPFATRAGARMYRTGDFARFRADGNLDFLGRIDHQVKIRGYRIELGEIEAQLLDRPDIAEAVVAAREDTPGHRQLVAYLVPAEGAAPTHAEVRALLQERLPEYMVPAVYVTLASLPLSPGGKVDRRLLPEPDSERPELAGAYEEPRTSAERQLAGIWQEVLGVDRVGVTDNFFELGGDSILSIQIVGRASRVGLRLTPRLIFEHQTIAELATAGVDVEQPPAAEEKRPAQEAPASDGDGEPAPEDFPLAQLDKRALDRILKGAKSS